LGSTVGRWSAPIKGRQLRILSLGLVDKARSVKENSAGGVEDGPQSVQIRGSKDDAVACSDVDEIEVDPCLRDLSGKVGEHAGVVLDVDDHDLPLT
jgi:hypothetical protein